MVQWQEWLKEVGKTKGAVLTNHIPYLDHVEIENWIASEVSCSEMMTSESRLKIVEFNAERGKHWHDFARLVQTDESLKDPDVIVLNEMDIGMARSGNVHTARKLAWTLQMNYNWGLEFVELTNGNVEEQIAMEGQQNTLGLHGNAILSKYRLYDGIVMRDPLADGYFSTQGAFLNTNGSEKRLGGLMGILVRTGSSPDEAHWVVGSVHKLKMTEHKQTLDQYLHSNSTETPVIRVTLGGDFERPFLCRQARLKNLDLPRSKTWPASCSTAYEGRLQGDNFCGSNELEIVEPERTIFPCVPSPPKAGPDLLQLSDHMITTVSVRSKLHV